MNFDQAFEWLIGHEGGYVNHPNDPGGETKYGISKRSYPGENIKEMTLVRAKDIYQRDYWWKAGCDLVPDCVKFDLFDTAVNAGPGTAIRMLQRAMRKREKVVVDFVAEYGISKATAYRYVGPDGELRASAMRVLELQREGRGKRS